LTEPATRVVLTGVAGLLGGILADALGDDFELSGIDRRRTHTNVPSRRVDLRRMRPLTRAFEGAEVVVHLAANPDAEAPWSDVYENNIRTTLNVFEAARAAGVRRVIFASSNHVTGMYERDEPYASICSGDYDGLDPDAIPKITSEWPVRPDGPYGVGKVLGEAAGRYYAEEYGMSVICLRIGTVSRTDRPGWVRHFATLLTHADLVRLTRASIVADPELRFGIYYGISANRWGFWDLEAPRRELGYEPQDDAERLRDSPEGAAASARRSGG
jgi:nucleoside-diphosphate-sugar epimerase